MTKIFGAFPIRNEQLAQEILSKYNMGFDTRVSMLPYAGAIGREIRHLYFNLAVGEDGLFRDTPLLSKVESDKILNHLPITRLFSFGECNAFCPYCKRDMQFLDEQGNVLAAETASMRDLLMMAEGAIKRNEIVRFSGGDPVLFPKVCMAISEYVIAMGGKPTSIAHNGSGFGFVRNLLPLMSSAAIDIKAPIQYMGTVLGLSQAKGEHHYRNSLKTQGLFHSDETNPNLALLDVRTPVFGPHPNPNVPQTTLSDMMQLAIDITENNDPRRTFWTWRLYKKVAMCDWTEPNIDDVLDMMLKVSAAFPKQWMGIRAKWHAGGMIYCYGGQFVSDTDVDTHEKAGSGNTGECVTV